MPTFGTWEREVLEQSYDDVDFISAHVYYQPIDGDVDSFLASAVDMDRFIEVVGSTIDHVKAEKRSDKQVHISFDEWNVWYQKRYQTVEKIDGIDNWPTAPRLLEDAYTVTDAVVVGGLLISLLKHADRVKAASLAQLVNVIAPIMTEPGGAAWRQPTFYPFATTARLARGTALDVRVTSPTTTTPRHGEVPLVTAAATWDTAVADDPATGALALFLVNRSAEPVDVEIDHPSVEVTLTGGVQVVADHERAVEGPEHAAHVAESCVRELTAAELVGGATGGPAIAGRTVLTLAPESWTAIHAAATRT
jgi:alpha-N-arabinofuranosidase